MDTATTTTTDIGDSRDLNTSCIQDSLRQRLETKIAYIESQIDALPRFLPESYQYLMAQLDQHQQQLLSILLKDQFAVIDTTLSDATLTTESQQ